MAIGGPSKIVHIFRGLHYCFFYWLIANPFKWYTFTAAQKDFDSGFQRVSAAMVKIFCKGSVSLKIIILGNKKYQWLNMQKYYVGKITFKW